MGFIKMMVEGQTVDLYQPLTVGSRAAKQGKGEQELIQIPACYGQETTGLPKTGQAFVSNNLLNFFVY